MHPDDILMETIREWITEYLGEHRKASAVKPAHFRCHGVSLARSVWAKPFSTDRR